MQNKYLPEGNLIKTPENREYISSEQGLERAAAQGRILEAVALRCDSDMRLFVDLYGMRGIIEKSEAAYCRPGESVKDIAVISRVGKPVCFKVLGFDYDAHGIFARLSRRDAQRECAENYLADLIPGDIIGATVTHLENFGAFVDIGCGIASLLSVDCISVSRISHPRDRLTPGMPIRCAVRSVDRESGRIFVTMRELLGTWAENAANFEIGHTVAGIVRSIESYGIFIELAPNLAGLAELREENLRCPEPGEYAAVYIKNILPERMKIKLVLIDSHAESAPLSPPRYFVGENVTHIDHWLYSPPYCKKVVETVFE
ncbi:MAG: 30S ribosomal protein S1 [Ruminococcaceae bacterium]|nr:30S ribosomal protein S1 [Oscillospiraceae bacterium]